MRNRDKQKFLQFHFITGVVASGILSARWLWMELRVQEAGIEVDWLEVQVTKDKGNWGKNSIHPSRRAKGQTSWTWERCKISRGPKYLS